MRNVVRLYQLAERRSNLYIILNSRTQILKEATVQNIEF